MICDQKLDSIWLRLRLLMSCMVVALSVTLAFTVAEGMYLMGYLRTRRYVVSWFSLFLRACSVKQIRFTGKARLRLVWEGRHNAQCGNSPSCRVTITATSGMLLVKMLNVSLKGG